MAKDCTLPEILLPSSPGYGQARQIYNRSIQRFPAAIVYCETERDVAFAVCEAKRRGCTVRVRGGGHNYEGFCIGDNVVVLDMRRMNHSAIDPARSVVRVGAGIRNAALYELVGAAGYPFPSGTCPTVGAAGLTQGGGWGMSARMFGLTCDSLIGARLIDANGQLHCVSETSEPDLFFALRGGGGGNFGVVTALTYKLPPKLFAVTYVNITASSMPLENGVAVFSRFQAWLKQQDFRFTPLCRIFNSETLGYGFFVRGIYYGTQAQAETSLAPFLTLPGITVTMQEATFLDAIRMVEQGYPPYEKFRDAGRFAPCVLQEEEMRRIVLLIAERAPGTAYASIGLFGLGGRVREVAPRETAFFYRDAPYIIDLETRWEHNAAEPAALAWMQPRYSYLQSITPGAYINFPSLLNRDYMQAYYGGNAARLLRIKQRYDPTQLFCFPQSIRP